MAEYWVSDDLKEICEDLITNFHSHLASANIGYLFRDVATKKNLTLDKSVVQVCRGKASKLGAGKMELLTGMDFVIEVPYDEWQTWNSQQRRYVLDTLLSQMMGEEEDDGEGAGEMKWFMIPLPISFVPDVVSRQGMPFDELRDAYRIMRAADNGQTAQIMNAPVTDGGLFSNPS